MRIIDAHTHLKNDAVFTPLFDMAQRLGYERLTVLSLQSAGMPLQNLICALCKHEKNGGIYAFGGLDYPSFAAGTDFGAQIEHLYDCGFDGIKMIEGKPTARRLLGKAVDDPAYDPYYEFCEKKGFPILMHIADPGTFWDKDKVPPWALKNGWYYGGGDDVPYEQYYEEVNNMLAKHPKLRVIFAHFYFLSGNPERLQKFLDDHPAVFIDVTAGVEMYEDFSLDPDFWRAFFVKNQNRILFGTDSTDAAPGQGNEVALDGYAGMEIDFLKYHKPIEIFNYKLHGIGLPGEALKKIFADNYLGLVGEPRPLNYAALEREAERVRAYIGDDTQKLEAIMGRLRA
jgi:predicted TIM-barrel fold metal-dependent hydrolase